MDALAGGVGEGGVDAARASEVGVEVEAVAHVGDDGERRDGFAGFEVLGVADGLGAGGVHGGFPGAAAAFAVSFAPAPLGAALLVFAVEALFGFEHEVGASVEVGDAARAVGERDGALEDVGVARGVGYGGVWGRGPDEGAEFDQEGLAVALLGGLGGLPAGDEVVDLGGRGVGLRGRGGVGHGAGGEAAGRYSLQTVDECLTLEDIRLQSAMSPLRISGNQALVLNLLTRCGDSYGLELVRASEGGLKRGSVYVTLDRMEDKGLVESWTEPSPEGRRGPARRRYRATGLGEVSLSNWMDGLRSSFPGLSLASGMLLTAFPADGWPTLNDMANRFDGVVVLTAVAISLLSFYMARIFGERIRRLPRNRYYWYDHQNCTYVEVQPRGLFTSLFGGARENVTEEVVRRARERELETRTIAPPGVRMMRFLHFAMPRKWVERRVEQTYQDELEEYFQDLENGNMRRARWVWFRMVARILLVVALSVPMGLWDYVAGEVSSVFRSAD